MSTVIAFHGGYLTPAAMRRDMGNPSWVDHYLDNDSPEVVANVLRQLDSVTLVGYSIGGSLIGYLSHLLDNIRAAVLYESPLIGLEAPAGAFPVLWIRNRYESTPRREKEFASTKEAWKQNHLVTEITGRGRHITWLWGWPPFGHAWDTSLNDWIANWIELQND